MQTTAIITNLFCLLNSFCACAKYFAMRALLKSRGVFIPFHLFHFTLNLKHCGPFASELAYSVMLQLTVTSLIHPLKGGCNLSVL
jgi:hypothetical protein